MKGLNLLIWVPQFGISIVFPLIAFILGAVWLHEELEWGSWVIVVGILCGLITAAVGVRDTIKAMELIEKRPKKESKPTVSFNSHD